MSNTPNVGQLGFPVLAGGELPVMTAPGDVGLFSPNVNGARATYMGVGQWKITLDDLPETFLDVVIGAWLGPGSVAIQSAAYAPHVRTVGGVDLTLAAGEFAIETYYNNAGVSTAVDMPVYFMVWKRPKR